MQRPAEQLATSIDQQIRLGWRNVTNADFVEKERVVSVATLRRWLKLAKSIDARMRLDGSKLNKRRAKKAEAK